MKRAFFITLILVNAVAAFCVSYTEYVLFNRFDEAFITAKILKKAVLLIISQPQCVFSSYLREEVLSEASVSNFLRNHYIVVEIYPETEKFGHFSFGLTESFFDINGNTYSYEDFYNIFLLRGTPTNVFFSQDQKLVSSFTGSVPPQEYLQIGKYLAQGLFLRSVDWNGYKKEIDPYIGTTNIVSISAENRDYVLKNAKNLRSIDIQDLEQSSAEELDPYLYYLFEETDEKVLRQMLTDKNLTLYNLYLVGE